MEEDFKITKRCPLPQNVTVFTPTLFERGPPITAGTSQSEGRVTSRPAGITSTRGVSESMVIVECEVYGEVEGLRDGRNR